MTALMNFYKEFCISGFKGEHFVKDEHTLILCKGNIIISQCSLEFISKNLPENCSYFVSTEINDSGDSVLYICVYDD